MKRRASWGVGWALLWLACAEESAPDAALLAEAESYCSQLGADACPSAGPFEACRDCYLQCGAPCRADLALCNDEFACEE